MSLWRTYQNLNPKTKALVGTGLLAWGLLGLTFSDKVESKLGVVPSESDKAELERMAPKIHVVDRHGAGGGGDVPRSSSS